MSTVETADDALHKGNLEFLDLNFKGALEQYNLSIELDDTNPDAFLKRALCYEKLRRLGDVVADTTKAIALDPMYIKAYRLKGEASYEKGDYQVALEAFEKCNALDPRDSIFLAWLEKCKGSKATSSSSGGSKATSSGASKPTPTSSSSSHTSHTNSNSNSNSAPQPARPPAPQAPKAPRAPKVSADAKPEEPAQAPKPEATPEPAPAPAQPVQPPQPQRYTWIQTDSFVVITIFQRGVKKEETEIDFEPTNLSVSFKLSSDNQFLLDLELAHEIDPAGSKFEIMTTKIEIKLRKAQPLKWTHVEKQEEVAAPPPAKKEKKNWDKIAKKAEEEEDKDTGFNQLMKDMYSGASEEERRAMMKSFHESGGTVLSCDWKDVGKGYVDPKPPAGVTRYEKDYV